MSSSLPHSIWVAGAGYVGRLLAEHLFREGAGVLALTRSSDSARSLRNEVPYPVLACDLSSPASLHALAESRGMPKAIVHCASPGRRGAASYRSVYYEGCVNLATTCPASLLLFTSSTGVYPQIHGETVTEASPANPAHESGRMLRAAEDSVLQRGGIVARLAGIYGPGRSIYLQRFLDGSATLEPGPGRFINQIHREDIVSALILLLKLHKQSAGQVYNVSDGNAQTQRSCYESLANFFSQALPPEDLASPAPGREWTNKRVDSSRLRALGWTPRYPSFQQALRDDPSLVPSLRRQTG